jgi:2'-5' RNA ligase
VNDRKILVNAVQDPAVDTVNDLPADAHAVLIKLESRVAPNLTAAADVHTGAMIAFLPSEDDAHRIAIEGGEPIDQLHLTIKYLGEAADIPEEIQQQIIDRVSQACGALDVIDAEAFGIALFNPGDAEPDRESCTVLLVQGDELSEAYEFICEQVHDLIDQSAHSFKTWIPHVTLTYDENVDLESLVDQVGPITFDRVRVAFGGENYDIPLESEQTGTDQLELETSEPPQTPEQTGIYTEPTAASGAFDFDPNEPRDPHSGKWIDTTPGGIGGVKEVGDLLRGDSALSGVTDDANLSLPERKAANNYAVSSRSFNDTLRKSGGKQADYSRVIDVDALDEAMDDHRSTHDIQTWRGFTDPAHVFGSAWKEDGDNTGLSWVDHGYTSTTTDDKPNWGDGAGGGAKSWGDGLVMQMTVPKGSRALRLSPGHSDWSDQHEVLLGRGSRFAITKDHGVVDRPDGSRGRMIDVSVIPNDTPPPPEATVTQPYTYKDLLKRRYGDNPTDRERAIVRDMYDNDPSYLRDLERAREISGKRDAERATRQKDRPKKKRKLFGRG